MIKIICSRIKREEFILFPFPLNVHPNLHINSDKSDRKSGSSIFRYSKIIYLSSCKFTKKNYCPPKFLKYMYFRWVVLQNFFCCLSKIYKWSYLLTKNKLSISFEECFISVDLVSVEVITPARFASYGRKKKYPRLLLALYIGLENLPLLEKWENINRSSFSCILNTCNSKTMGNHNSLSRQKSSRKYI